METHIAILNGNGIHNLPHSIRSWLHLEGLWCSGINNFSKFEVDRIVSYHRPEVERVATSLDKTFFPGAKLEPAPQLADSIAVKVVLGHDLGPSNRPKPRRFRCRGSKVLSQPGPVP